MKQEDESSYLEGHWRDKGGRSSELEKKASLTMSFKYKHTVLVC